MSHATFRDPLHTLREVFGFDSFRGEQRDVVDHLAAGRDALVIMPTGGGKSLCYQLPALLREGTAIVVSPLIALMQDQVAALEQLGVRAVAINSSLSSAAARQAEQAMLRGEYQLIYVAPERLCQPRFLDLVARMQVSLFAIDEAHCVSQWGHDFRPEYRQLTLLHERFPDVPRIALTATADEPTRIDIIDRLNLHEAQQFISGFDRPNIRYRVQPKNNTRKQLLRFLSDEHAGDAGIVYCMSRRKTESTASWLSAQGFNAIAYHAGLESDVRQATQDRFIREEGLIIVATIAFGMGIDKSNVRFVAHLDLPKSIEAYYQETGRAGRDGLPANAWMVFGLQDAVMLRQFIEDSEAGEAQKALEHRKLNALLGYCETTRCRRSVLLEYFGETRDNDNCGNCDVCLDPIEKWDATEPARKALSCIYRTGQRFGAGYVIDVLLGSGQERITRNGHDQVSTYGIGADFDRKRWQSIFRQLLTLRLIEADFEHGGLRLTSKAGPVLRGEEQVMLRRDRKQSKRVADTSESRPTLVDAEDRALFERLRALRLQLAEQQQVPPYVVFNDRSLVEMARQRPSTLGQMRRIHGVGDAKLQRYGDQFLEAIETATA